MKRIILLIVVLVPLIARSQVQPTATSEGFTNTGSLNASSFQKDMIPGTLVWSQLPSGSYSYASQSALNYPFDAKVFDDFLFPTSPGRISAVRWWIGYWNPSYAAPSSFNIIVYDNNGCLPGNMVASWNIPFANANEEFDLGSQVGTYWALLSPVFIPVAGEHYWIVFQPVLDFPPQTGWVPSITMSLCTGKQDFPILGVNMADLGSDFAFELYASAAPSVPISNLALYLGILLMVVFVAIRFRSMA